MSYFKEIGFSDISSTDSRIIQLQPVSIVKQTASAKTSFEILKWHEKIMRYVKIIFSV